MGTVAVHTGVSEGAAQFLCSFLGTLSCPGCPSDVSEHYVAHVSAALCAIGHHKSTFHFIAGNEKVLHLHCISWMRVFHGEEPIRCVKPLSVLFCLRAD